MYYNFNPNLKEPWNVIHPFQLPAVQQLCKNEFPQDIEAIFLFGSSLDLSCHKYSDLDLYVATANSNASEVYDYIYAKCLPLKKRFDILIGSMEDLEHYKNEVGTIESQVAERGVCIYAK